MIRIVANKFEGLWVAPDHPVTCANPAPWQVTEMKLEANPLKVWIRCERSMWFRADQCFIGHLADAQFVVDAIESNAVERAHLAECYAAAGALEAAP